MDKKGKLSTLLFIGVTILPLLGLLIMDYQLKQANDITGAYVVGGPATYAAENLMAGAVILGVIALIAVVFAVGKLHKSKLISTMPLAKINEDIKEIDERLNRSKEAEQDAS